MLRVVEDSTRQVLPGVVVRLLVGARVVATGLTGESGRVTLRAPVPGRYDLTANRIGHEGYGPVAVDVAAGSQSREIMMPRAVRLLPPIVVTADTRCDDASGPGTAAAALWEDIRTALTANALTASEGRVVLYVTRFERDLTPDREFLRERVIRRRTTRGQPFVSEDAEQLLSRGFVYREEDSLHYAAPDAVLLLTDTFVQGHCFSVRTDGRPGARLGLAFEPVPERRVPEVRGTLWLDAESRELRHLEFMYTGLGPEEGLGGPGGRIDFRRLADGSWIVHDWTLSMPRVGRIRGVSGQARVPGERYRLLGWLEAGGRAEVAPDAKPTTETGSILSGLVVDSLLNAPLAGAIISIDGEPDSSVTNASGRFQMSVRGAGPRSLRVTHDRLALVPDNSTQEVRLRSDHATEVNVSVPPIGRFVRTFCELDAGQAGIIGIVRAGDGVPRQGKTVRATWHVALGARAAIQQRQPHDREPRARSLCLLRPPAANRRDVGGRRLQHHRVARSRPSPLGGVAATVTRSRRAFDQRMTIASP